MIRPGIRRLLRLPIRRRDLAEQEMDEEIRLHLELRAEQLEQQGCSPEEARAEAARRFGPPEEARRTLRRAARRREGWMGAREWVDALGQDLRYGWRQLRRSPGFALAAVLTLALGIGGTTVIFGVVDAIFLRYPAGVSAPERVVQLWVVRDEGSIQTTRGGPGSYVDYEALRSGTRAFSELAATLSPQTMDLGRGADAEQVEVGVVSQTYFPLLGVRPAVGRLFLPEEDRVAGAHPVAVVSHGFWRRRLGADPQVLGRTLELNGQFVTVVGVMEPEFTGIGAEPLDAWVPMATASLLSDFFEEGWRLNAQMAGVLFVGRLAPGATPERAMAEAGAALRTLAEQHEALDPTPEVLAASLIPGRSPHRPQAADLSLWLALVAGMVLVIAAANVANLLLARSTARRRELAVRSSLGAGRARLLRQHLTESLLLAGLGGAAGLLVAYWGSAIVRQFPVPPSAGRIDGRILGFALAVSLVTGLLFGIVPALRASRVDAAEGLKEGRSAASRGRLRRALIALQVCLSLVLLVGAGLFVRSLRAVYAVDPGVDVERLMTVTMNLDRADVPAAERPEVHRAALERLRRVPGVSRAALTHFVPFGNTMMSVPFRAEGRDTTGRKNSAVLNLVSAGYFETAGTQVLAGRGFIPDDEASDEPIAVVNQILAREIAPDGSAVGQCVAFAGQVMNGGCTRIVGVVEETRRRLLEPQEEPQYYLSWDQRPDAIAWGTPALLVRLADDAPVRAEAIRAAVQGLRPDLPYVQVQPLEELIRSELLPYRLGATLLSLFAALALALAAVGVYGVLAYFVTERTPEIGIRRSLGASRHAIVSLIVRQGMAPVAVGLGLGLGIALAGSSLIGSLLFGVGARDPLVFAAVAVFLTVVALLSTLLPARRAARVDPMVALRHE